MKIKFSQLLVCVSIAFFSCSEQEVIDNELQTQPQKTVSEKISSRSISFENVAATEWMQLVPDALYTSQLSIPGTHETAALYEGWPGTAKCQKLTIAEQLNIGVRYLDIRCRHMNDTFRIFHGFVDQKQTFSDVLAICKRFLQSHPSETIFMAVKTEYTSQNNTREYYETFQKYLDTEAKNLFFLEDRIPTMGEARGKIVLIRRFASPITMGIQADKGWNDNSSTLVTIDNAQNNFIFQDMYKFNDNATKWSLFLQQFQNCKQDRTSTNLYLNNLSGYKPGIFGIPNITGVSNELNPKLKNYLTVNTKNIKMGIIGLDFIDREVAKQIYTAQNF